MKVQEYLDTLLKFAGMYKLSDVDEMMLKKGVVEYALSKLMSKKYRKWKLDQSCIERTKKALEIQVENKLPIKVIFFQGGYKLWRFPSSPQADWAEFFNLAYVLSYVAPIANAYRPGVELIYYCHTLLMETHDNLSTDEIQEYMSSFSHLQSEFSKFLPKNIKLSILRDADIYSRDEYFEALEKGKHKAESDIKNWPEAKIKDFERMATLNIKWKGKEDWSKLSTEDKLEKIHQAALYEQAATSNLPKVMERVKAPDTILLFTKASPIFIGIGSTFSSMAKYWVGTGVLQKKDNNYLPRILTPSQYEKSRLLDYEKVEIANSLGKNFKTIEVFAAPLQFEKYNK